MPMRQLLLSPPHGAHSIILPNVGNSCLYLSRDVSTLEIVVIVVIKGAAVGEREDTYRNAAAECDGCAEATIRHIKLGNTWAHVI